MPTEKLYKGGSTWLIFCWGGDGVCVYQRKKKGRNGHSGQVTGKVKRDDTAI